jgi:hypothetical protein
MGIWQLDHSESCYSFEMPYHWPALQPNTSSQCATANSIYPSGVKWLMIPWDSGMGSLTVTGHSHGVFILATSSKEKWTTNPTESQWIMETIAQAAPWQALRPHTWQAHPPSIIVRLNESQRVERTERIEQALMTESKPESEFWIWLWVWGLRRLSCFRLSESRHYFRTALGEQTLLPKFVHTQLLIHAGESIGKYVCMCLCVRNGASVARWVWCVCADPSHQKLATWLIRQLEFTDKSRWLCRGHTVTDYSFQQHIRA